MGNCLPKRTVTKDGSTSTDGDKESDIKVKSEVPPKADTKEQSLDRIRELRNMTDGELDNLEETNYTDILLCVRVTDVYDGDTFTCVFWDPYMNRFNSKRCRLNGVDAPEMKPPLANKNRDREKKLALESKGALIKWVNDGYLVCRTYKWEKWGRLLVDIYKFDEDTFADRDPFTCNEDIRRLLTEENALSEYMVDNDHAVYYKGDKKTHVW